MTDNLKKELQTLLENYPELNGCNLNFSGTDISLLSSDKTPDTHVSESQKSGAEEKPSNSFSVEVITGNSPKIEIRKSPIHGYGVFAKEAIEEGERIDQCRLLKLGHRANYNNDPVLKDYVWAKKDESAESKQHGNNIYMALGFGSMYNHSDQPNTTQSVNFNTEVMTVNGGRLIEKDEEIFVNYGKKYFMIRNFWKNVHKNQAFEKVLEKYIEHK